jgi:hypothetical protein
MGHSVAMSSVSDRDSFGFFAISLLSLTVHNSNDT